MIAPASSRGSTTLQRRRPGAEVRAGRRDRRRPADRHLPPGHRGGGLQDRRPVRRPRRQQLGRGAEEGLRADPVRGRGGRTLRASGELEKITDSGSGPRRPELSRPPPRCPRRGAPGRPRGGPAPAGAPRDGGRRRLAWWCSAASRLLIVTSPGWADVQRTFFEWDRSRRLPGGAARLLARREAVHGRRGVVLVAGPRRRDRPHHRAPALFPLRLLAVVFTDVMRGVP